MLEFYPIEMRATLFALHWVALFVGAWLLFRHQSVVAEPAEKQGIAFEVGVIICTLIACFTPIRYFWTFMHLFPGHVTSDLYGGLPISDVTSQSLAGYVFNDFGRSSYIYHLLLAGLYRIPGFEIPHLFPLFLVLACLFVYVWIRAVGRASFPALGLLVVLFSPEAWEHLVESFLSRRSWGTELVSLGVALLMLAPGNVRTSRYALSGALVCLSLAAQDNPLQLLHLAGFGIGVAAIWYAGPSSAPSRFTRGVLALCYGVLLLTTAAAASYAYMDGTTNGATPQVGFLDWLGQLRNDGVLGWYVALGLLLLVPPPREWWPLCGAAIFGALGTIGIVLVMEHPLFYDAARFWKPTFPVVVMTVLGLTGSHGLRLLDSRPWKLHLQSAVVVALLFIAMVATTKRQPDLEQGLRKQVVRFEQGIRLYTHFVRSEPHAGPVVMIDSSDLFDWLSIEGVLGGSRPNSRKRYHLEGLLGGQWREEPFSCDADGVYYVVTEEKRDLASECDRCTPYSPVGVVPAQARPRRPQTRWFREPPLPNHALAFYPWAIWHCR